MTQPQRVTRHMNVDKPAIIYQFFTTRSSDRQHTGALIYLITPSCLSITGLSVQPCSLSASLILDSDRLLTPRPTAGHGSLRSVLLSDVWAMGHGQWAVGYELFWSMVYSLLYGLGLIGFATRLCIRYL